MIWTTLHRTPYRLDWVKFGSEGGKHIYSETSLIRHSMGPENNVGLGGCWIMECLLPYLRMVTVPHIMVGLERVLDYRGVGVCCSVEL